MSFFENIKEGVRSSVREFLQISESSTVSSLSINQEMTHEVNVSMHKILYRVDPYETEQLFKTLNGSTGRFWSAVPAGPEFRKIRNDVYQLIIDTLSDIVITGLNAPEFKDKSKEEIFNEIFSDKNELNFWKLCKKAVTDVLKTGDGAFKISYDNSLSQTNDILSSFTIQFYDAEFVEYVYKYGRLLEIIFYTNFKEDGHAYTLKEYYGRGYVRYELFKNKKLVSLGSCKATENLQDFNFEGDYIMAQQVKIWESPKYEGRGKPLMDGKIDALDALDEIDSEWQDAFRAGIVKSYIPDPLIPKNKYGDEMRPNAFENKFRKVQGNLTPNSANEITTVQPDIKYEAFLQSYVAALDRVLMGIISPSTLGIDARKLDDNATAQREREKITAWKRDQITDVLKDILPALIDKILKTYANIAGTFIEDTDVIVEFDEYNSPGIEQKIEIVAKAIPNSQLIPWRKAAQIIFDDLTDEEQEEIAEELKALNNPTIEEPAMYPTDYDKMNEDIEE